MADIIPFGGLLDYGDAVEKQCMDRLAQQFNRALKTALQRNKDFFQKCQDVRNGVIKPPSYVLARGAEGVLEWQNGFIRELMRQMDVVKDIAGDFEKAANLVPGQLDDMLADVYGMNRKATTDMIVKYAQERQNIAISFAQYDKRQIKIILDENKGAMTKIAYNRFKDAEGLQDRLQNELFQATVLGESKQKLVKRIQQQIEGNYKPDAITKDPWIKGCRNVAEYQLRCARRIAQTERTRVQSQARWEACQEAKEHGVRIVNEWSARMVNTRETHAAVSGTEVEQGKKFILPDGDALEYPGDPNGKACNVINCYCTLIPRVLLRHEQLPPPHSPSSKPEGYESGNVNENGENSLKDIENILRKYGKSDNIELVKEEAEQVNGKIHDFVSQTKNIMYIGSLYKVGDPLYEKMGRIIDTNPNEMRTMISLAESLGVEVINDGRGISYSPGLFSGKAGQLHVSSDNSYGAWAHEVKHMLDDARDGFPGFRALQDKERTIRMEKEAYQIEIDIAVANKWDDTANELRARRDAEILVLRGEIWRDDYEKTVNELLKTKYK